MGTVLAAAGGALVALLLVALVALVRRRDRSRTDLVEMLTAAQREADDLRGRLEALSAVVPDHPSATPVEPTAYLITDAGRAPAPAPDPIEVPDRVVLTATLGTPLVKVAAFGHGLRRALAPEARNRILFEMRREVRAARKRRKRLVKQYQRDLRADERAREGLA